MGRFESFRRAPNVPVIPGRPVPVVEDCAACGRGDRNGVLRTRTAIEGIEMVLCVDYFACSDRVRELLAAAS